MTHDDLNLRLGAGLFSDPNAAVDYRAIAAQWVYLLTIIKNEPDVLEWLRLGFLEHLGGPSGVYVFQEYLSDDAPTGGGLGQKVLELSAQWVKEKGLTFGHAESFGARILLSFLRDGPPKVNEVRSLTRFIIFSFGNTSFSYDPESRFCFALRRAEAGERPDVQLFHDFRDYNPTRETLSEARSRIVSLFRSKLTEHLEALEATARHQGLEKIPEKRDRLGLGPEIHFEWLYYRARKGMTITKVVEQYEHEKGFDIAAVSRATRELAKLIGIDLTYSGLRIE